MPRRHVLTSATILAAVVAGLIAGIAVPASAARPPGFVTSGEFGDIVFDPADHRLFVSARPDDGVAQSQGGLFVTDAKGTTMQRIAGVSSAGDLALSPDRATLYATTATGIVEVDTKSLTATRIDTRSTAPCPHALAPVAGRLWFSFGCRSTDTVESPGIGVLDPATKQVTADADANGYGWSELAAVPGHDDQLLVSPDDARDGHQVTLDTISGTTLTPIHSVDFNQAGTMVVAPDGKSVLLQLGGNEVHNYALPGFADVGPTYRFADRASSAAYSPNGHYLALSSHFYKNLVGSYGPDSRVTIRTWDTSSSLAGEGYTNQPALHGLVWEGSTLVVVYVDYLGDNPTIKILANATNPPTKLSVSAPRTSERAAPLVITGRLLSHGKAVPRQRLAMTRTDLDGTRKLARVTTGADGRFTIKDRPTVGGTNTYTIRYSGDGRYSSSSHSVRVAVARKTTALTLHTDRNQYGYGQRAQIQAHLGKTYRERSVAIYTRVPGGKTRLIKTARVDRRGNLEASIVAKRNFVITAKFAGDERYAPRSVTLGRKTNAALKTLLSKPIGRSGKYWLFLHTKGAGFAAKLRPAQPNAGVEFRLQVERNNVWHTTNTVVGYLNEKSVAAVAFNAGTYVPARIRAEFHGGGGSAAVTSRWWYAEFR